MRKSKLNSTQRLESTPTANTLTRVMDLVDLVIKDFKQPQFGTWMG